MKMTLGISPCPNDTFIFDALVNGKIDTAGLTFDVVLEDVQTLNQWAIAGKLDISKVSYGALPQMLQHYVVLHSGSALGKGVGPLLISGDPLPKSGSVPNIDDYTIAIPGENTTAHLLFQLAFPGAKKKIFKVFNEIEDFLTVVPPPQTRTAGVIIHENRFTYQKKGLHKWLDLGDYWEKLTGCPIPLGGIVTRRHYNTAIHSIINGLIKQSAAYAFERYPHLAPYVVQHAQEMEEEVMRQHIGLYVNEYTLDLGTVGMSAVEKCVEISQRGKSSTPQMTNIFIQPNRRK